MTCARPQSSPMCSPWIRQRSSPTKSLLRTPTAMMLHWRICSTEHIEFKPITQYEKTFLSVCRRRQCPIEHGNLLEIDRGNPVSTEAQKHRFGLYSMITKSKFLQNANQELVNTNFKQLEPKKSNDSFEDNYCSKSWHFVTLIKEVSLKWKNYGNFRVLPSIRSPDENLSRIRTLFGIIMQSTGISKWSKLYEWFKGVSECWINTQWKFPRYQSTSVIPTSSNAWRDVEAIFCIAERKGEPPSVWGTHVFSETFLQIHLHLHQPLISRTASMEFVRRRLHSSTVEKSERPEQSQDLRCQSGPSAKDSVIFNGGDYSKNYGADQQRLQNSDLHFDKFFTPATCACWKIRFKTEVCMYSFTISYGSYAMDQRSGDGWFSGWFKIFVIKTRYFNAKFWSTWCVDCFSNEHHP